MTSFDLRPGPLCRPASRRSPILVVGDAASDELTRQCDVLGLALADLSAFGPGKRSPTAALLAGQGDGGLIRTGLSDPFCGFVELGDEGIQGVGMRCLDTVRSGGLVLSLSTATAYAVDTMGLVSEAMRQSFHVRSELDTQLIEICLAEAISNAVIHGNLQIDGRLRATAEGFESFRQTMLQRLADPVKSRRRVEICLVPLGSGMLTIAVSDQGAGFDLAEKLTQAPAANAKSGRGLNLIRKAARSVVAEDCGRTLVMTFAH